jgi:hypothetical protein
MCADGLLIQANLIPLTAEGFFEGEELGALDGDCWWKEQIKINTIVAVISRVISIKLLSHSIS